MRMALVSQWYASIRYWLPLRDRTGKRPMSSVKSLLMGSSHTWSSLEAAGGMREGIAGAVVFGDLGLVERIPWWTCVRCPLMVLSRDGQYLEALAYARTG